MAGENIPAKPRLKVTPRLHHDFAHIPMSLPCINFQVAVSEICPRQDFKVKVSTPKSGIKPRSYHNVAHTHTPSLMTLQILTSNMLQTPRSGPDKNFKGQGNYSKVKSQIKSQNGMAHIHSHLMSIQRINILLLTVSEIQPGQGFFSLPSHPPIGTSWAKTIPCRPSKAVG